MTEAQVLTSVVVGIGLGHVLRAPRSVRRDPDRMEAAMSDLAFAMTVCEPKRITATSWWCDSPREHFTERARQRQFSSAPRRGDRIRTIAEEIVAASRND